MSKRYEKYKDCPSYKKAQRKEYVSQKTWKPLLGKEKLKAHQLEMSKKKEESEAPPKVRIQHVTVERDLTSGRWLKGCSPQNITGRPKLGTNRLELLLNAVRRVESRENKNLLEYFIERAFDDDGVLIALIKKLHPDLAAIQLSALSDDSINDEIALSIQEKLRNRYESRSSSDDSETPPLLESTIENPT